MNDTSLYREICGKIREIVNDSADSIENRLDRVIALQDSIEELEKKEKLRV